jgi:hypothetical protein
MQGLAKAAIAVLLMLLLGGFDDPIEAEVKGILARLDYIAITPSSNAYAPGSFVYRINFDPKILPITSTQLGFLCTPGFSTAKIDDAAIRTPMLGGLSGLFGNAITLDRQFVHNNLVMPYTSQYSDGVVVRILDQATVGYSDEKLTLIRQKLGPDCSSSVKTGIAKGNAYQIASVYELRLQFEVRYRDDLNDQIKRNILAEVRRFGTPTNEDNAQIIKGQTSVYGLIWKSLQ